MSITTKVSSYRLLRDVLLSITFGIKTIASSILKTSTVSYPIFGQT